MKSRLPFQNILSIVDETHPETRSINIEQRYMLLKFIDFKYVYIGIIKIKRTKLIIINLFNDKFKSISNPLNIDMLEVFKKGLNFRKPLNILNVVSMNKRFIVILEETSRITNIKTNEKIISYT